jgi:hypothetical protein
MLGGAVLSWQLDYLAVETDKYLGVAHVVFELLGRRAMY